MLRIFLTIVVCVSANEDTRNMFLMMTRLFFPMCFYYLIFICEAQNKEGNQAPFKVPKPFIISTSFEIGNAKDTKLKIKNTNPENSWKSEEVKSHNVIDSSQPGDRRKENDRFYNFHNDNMKKYITSQSVNNNKSPKINFYSLNCLAGIKCSAIIPGPKTPMPPPKNLTDQEVRTYLKRYGLENGFNYFDDDKANKNSVVARYFNEEREKRENARKKRRGRKIASFYDYDDFWPGSEYRPNKSKKNYNKISSKAKIFKFGTKNIPNRKQFSNALQGTEVRPSSVGNVNKIKYRPSTNNNRYTHELPFPSFSNHKPPTIQKLHTYTQTQEPSNGWKRYSNSVISQYDKHKGQWVKVSGNNNNNNEGGNFNKKIKPLTQRPVYSGNKGISNHQHPEAQLGVFGVSYDFGPHLNVKPAGSYRPEYTPTHSSHQGYFPQSSDRPFSIHSPPSNSVSFPLNVLPSDLSDPVLIFANEGINGSLSNDSLAINSTYDSYHYEDYTDYIDLTQTNITDHTHKPYPLYPPPTTTRRPPPITRVVYINTPTQPPSSNTRAEGGGGGGGDGDGIIIPNAYAIMAAVGAGLIPASIAAILPVLLGRRRRRRRTVNSEGFWSAPSHLTPLVGKDSLPIDPILRFLLKQHSQNPQILR